MFDIGWSEMMVVAVLALIIIGPKELPRTMRTVAHWFAKARSLAREFQSGMDDIVREADLEDARKALTSARDLNPNKILSETVDPTGAMTEEIDEVERTAKQDSAKPALADEAERQKGKEQAEEKGAKIVKQPANIAPPHSLTPPAETAPKETDAAQTAQSVSATPQKTAAKVEEVIADSDTSQRRA